MSVRAAGLLLAWALEPWGAWATAQQASSVTVMAAAAAKEMRRLRHEGRPGAALEHFADLGAPSAADARVQGEQAQALLESGDVDAAAAVLTQPRPPGGLPLPYAVAVVRMQLHRGQLAEARKGFELLDEQVPGHADLALLAVELLLAEEDVRGAQEIFAARRDAIPPALRPGLEVDLLVARAAEYMTTDEFLERAVPLLEQALQVAPDRIDATALLTRALARWQRADRAEALVVEALDRTPDAGRVELLHALGMVRWHQQREAEARQAFEDALAIRPAHVSSRLGLAQCELLDGRTGAARDLAQACLGGGGTPADALVLLAEIALAEEDWDGAAGHLEALLEARPGHLRGLWLLSRVRARQGRQAEIPPLLQRYEERKRQLADGDRSRATSGSD